MKFEVKPMTESEQVYAKLQPGEIRMHSGSFGRLIATLNASTIDWGEADLRGYDDFIGMAEDLVLYLRTAPNIKQQLLECRNLIRVDTDKYSYMVVYSPKSKEFIVYPYIKTLLDSMIKEAEKGIRFLSSDNEELFRLQDGGGLIITHLDGSSEEYCCRYIDSSHFLLGEAIYHIRQFAVGMLECGSTYAPKGKQIDTYELYQLFETDYMFRPYKYAKAKITAADYALVYTGMFSSGMSLESLYMRHNADDRPYSRYMRSLSISDVIAIKRSDECKYYYVDSVGMVEITNFK